MSKFQKVMFALGLFATLPTHASNNASALVNVSGVVVKSLTVEVINGLRFGEVAKGTFDEGATEVTIDITNQNTGAFRISYTGSGSPDISADATGTESIDAVDPNRSVVGPGKVKVKGEPNYHYTMTPSTVTPVTGLTTVSMDIIFGGGAATLSSTLDATGEDVIYVGGIMTARKSVAVLGTHTGTVDITVIYD